MNREQKCIILSSLLAGLVVGNGYTIMVYPKEKMLILGGIFLLVLTVGLLMDNFITMKKEEMQAQLRSNEEEKKWLLEQIANQWKQEEPKEEPVIFDEMLNTQKGLYVAIQKQTKALQAAMEQVSGQIGTISEEMHQIADRNAKIGVKYNKENTKSLMVFQQKAFDNVTLGMEETVRQYVECSDKMIAAMETCLKNLEVHAVPMQSAETLQSVPVAEIMPEPEMAIEAEAVAEPEVAPEAEAMAEPEVALEAEAEAEPEVVLEAEAMAEPEVALEAEAMAEPEVALEAEVVAEPEAVPEPEPEPAVEMNADPNHIMTPEEIAALVGGSAEPEVAPEPEPEPAVEMNADPNHIMTPEEIAALVGGSEEPEAAPEPEPEPAPAVEMNADPNHIMTPEEIAALVGNL